MAQIDDIEKRLNKLESRVDSSFSEIQKFADATYKHVTTLEKRFDRNLRDQNTVNAKSYKHITAMEARFAKMDKGAKKLVKMADPRVQERITMKLVDQALKTYDQKRGK
ncbi:hypothetical protein LGT41_0002440 [Abyssibius alkaniclasticus]|uniref:hypothetical protein n=1 Tax=Abyssibius alkaniclasticus TaxID=2881234 RepID=UPI0023648352|nr:hypothetical protein [Abyssibius alkaniclasticus]UPH71696.1 hypothetical protein LGT41_0002440 [Abyssibius alkaniclasticus]|tara:strand:- start:408 stop:734 length:327 start_codon:yes stop_codon:yes gene_type:complete